MSTVVQHLAALTGHLSATHSMLQRPTGLDFKEALSPLQVPLRSVHHILCIITQNEQQLDGHWLKASSKHRF